MKINIEKQEKSQVKIDVTLPKDEVEKYREEVTNQALETIEIKGFRKGKAPKDVAMKEINSLKLLEEMSHRAISEHYIKIIQDQDIKAIGQPQITITKLAEGSDLEFSIITATLPEITLGDYQKIAKDINKDFKNEVDVDDKELNEAILNLRKMRAFQDMQQSNEENEVSEKKDEEAGTEAKQEDTDKETKKDEGPKSWHELDEKDLPAIDDKWAQSAGPFESLEDFKKKMKENLVAEKQSKETEKQRIAIIDGILEKSELDVPDMLVEYEIDKMMNEFEGNIAMSGVSFDEYLKSLDKTREDYRKEWQPQAKKRAQTQLMLNEIARKESIEPSDDEIDKEVKTILERYQNQKGITEDHVKSYVANVLTHQKVFEYLETQ